MHTGETPYSCDECQKSYTQSSGLSKHNKTAAHIERMKSKNRIIHPMQSSFVDCGESIKEEDIKEETKDDESVDDTLTIHQETENINVCEDIKKEIKNEATFDDLENRNICDDIKEEIKEETKYSSICEYMKEEVKEEGSVVDPLSIQRERK